MAEKQKLDKYMTLISTNFEDLIVQMKKKALKRQKLAEADKILDYEHRDPLLQRSRSPDSRSDHGGDDESEDSEEEHERIEITEDQYSKQLKKLNDAYWDLQFELYDQYDFGLIRMDFRPAKEKIL